MVGWLPLEEVRLEVLWLEVLRLEELSPEVVDEIDLASVLDEGLELVLYSGVPS